MPKRALLAVEGTVGRVEGVGEEIPRMLPAASMRRPRMPHRSELQEAVMIAEEEVEQAEVQVGGV